MSIEKEALSAIGRWINAAALRDDVVTAMQEGRMAQEDEQGTKVICEIAQAEKGLRAFWALYGAKSGAPLRTPEEDRKLSNLALGLLSRAYELVYGVPYLPEEPSPRQKVCEMPCPRCGGNAVLYSGDWRSRGQLRVECAAGHWGDLEPQSTLIPEPHRRNEG